MSHCPDPSENRVTELQRALRRQAQTLNRLEQRLNHLDNSAYQKLARAVFEFLREQRQLYRQGAIAKEAASIYEAWVENERTRSGDGVLQRQAIQNWRARPRISAFIPADRADQGAVERSRQSLLRQTYPPSEMTDRPETSQCDYVAILRAGDEVSRDALFHCGAALQDGQRPDLMYSDEDTIDSSGRRSSPLFKPGWSPELLRGGNYFGGLTLVEQSRFAAVGGWIPGCQGAEEYDLILRATDRPVSVRHIPGVLYHRNADNRLPGAPGAKSALERAAARRNWGVSIEEIGVNGWHRAVEKAVALPSVSVIVCSRSAELASRCLRKLKERTAYSDWEVIVVQHMQTVNPALVRATEKFGAKGVPYGGVFHYPRMNRLGADAAKGDILVFLNDDVEPLDRNWLILLVGQVIRPGIGVVGAKLLYPSGTVQHAGVALGMVDGAGHPGRGVLRSMFWKWLDFTRDVSAVTGACLAISRSLFGELGGFDDRFPENYNDVDLCLRARAAGWRVIYEAGAILRHREATTRVAQTTLAERELFAARWGTLLDHPDPYYNSCLRTDSEEPSLAFGC